MGILRALINNTFFVLLLLVAVTLYIAFSDSIKEDHGIKPETQAVVQHFASQESLHQVKSPEEKVESNTPAVTPVAEATQKEPVQKAEVSSDVEEVQPKVQPSTATKEDEHKPTVVEQTKVQPEAQILKTPSKTIETAEAPQSDVTVAQSQNKQPKTEGKVTEVKTDTDENKPAQPTQAMTKEEAKKILSAYPSSKAALSAAEKAYQAKNFKKSEEVLFAMTLWQPTPNLLGALGNVFYADHKIDWAKRAWAAAADQLIRQGQFDKAIKMAQALKSVASDLTQAILQRAQVKKSKDTKKK